MRIGIDARFLGDKRTGLARYSENLLEALARVDDQNDYVVFVNSRLRRKLKLGANFRLVPMRGNPLGLLPMLRMIKSVRRERLDLLHVHSPASPPLLDCPVLITVHDILPFARESAITGYRLRVWRLLWSYVLYTMTLIRVRWIICVSNATREGLCQLFPELRHKTMVMHSGVDEVFREPVEGGGLELVRSRLDLPRRYILYSGSIRLDKNITGLLRSFTLLRQRDPAMENLWLVMEIIAQDVEVEMLRRGLTQLGIDHRVRIVRDASEEERRVIFHDARLLVVLGRAEGFGFPILEAQASDVPVVAADAGALPEIAGENGAMLVDPENMESLVGIIERMLSDQELRAWLVEQGRGNLARFEWTRAAGQLIQIYNYLFYPRDQIELPPRNKLLMLVDQWLRL